MQQVSVCFCKESVQFRRQRDKIWFMHTKVYDAKAEDDTEVKQVAYPRLRKELFELISNYEPKKTETTNASMKIVWKDDISVGQSARCLLFAKNQTVNKQIDEWLERGITRPSLSEYASPIVLVKEKDGATVLCTDYRKLNRKLIKDRFPLSLIEDV